MELAQEKERAQELIDRTEREGQELLSVLKARPTSRTVRRAGFR